MASSDFNQRQPHALPDFTLDDVKNAIPKHCFERSPITSLSYLARDLALIGSMIATTVAYNRIALTVASATSVLGCDTSVLAPYIEAAASRGVLANSAIALFVQPFIFASLFTSLPLVVYSVVLTGLWVVFWWLQGVFMTGLWVLGHEAGHGALFDSKLANDVFGIITHSFLLVPYFAWQISHRRHHSHCGDLDLDEVHLPWHVNEVFRSGAHGAFHNDDDRTKLDSPTTFMKEVNTLMNDYSLIWRITNTMVFCFIGWWLYLATNVSGRRYPKNTKPNHFAPSSPIFSKEESKLIIIGDIALVFYLFLFYKFAASFGVAAFLALYFIPSVCTNWWLVTITLLQHTHPALPHFTSASWNYIQGALSTIDRDYGDFYNWALHNINDTHVTHHMFSYLPHYHAEEATQAIKKVIGPYYLKIHDERPAFGVIRSLLACWNDFHFVAEDHHPALTMAHAAYDAMAQEQEKTGADFNASNVQQKGLDAVSNVAADAYKNSPYGVEGKRDATKEVFWFRSMYFREPVDKKAN